MMLRAELYKCTHMATVDFKGLRCEHGIVVFGCETPERCFTLVRICTGPTKDLSARWIIRHGRRYNVDI